MQQIDQDPGGYRVQDEKGRWVERVNKPLCRWLGIASVIFLTFLGWRFAVEGGNGNIPLVFGAMGFLAGALITMSLKSLNW